MRALVFTARERERERERDAKGNWKSGLFLFLVARGAMILSWDIKTISLAAATVAGCTRARACFTRCADFTRYEYRLAEGSDGRR